MSGETKIRVFEPSSYLRYATQDNEKTRHKVKVQELACENWGSMSKRQVGSNSPKAGKCDTDYWLGRYWIGLDWRRRGNT